jgi:stage IV sporulation protein B
VRGLRRWIGAAVAAGVLAVAATPAARRVADLPTNLSLEVGQQRPLQLGLPGAVYLRASAASLRVNGRGAWRAWAAAPAASVEIQPVRVGRYHLEVRLFGLIPLRDVTVDALPEVDVVPGGQAIGVLLNSDGALVVGETGFTAAGGRRVAPAMAAGLRVGDVIVRADGRRVSSREVVREAVQRAGRSGRPLDLEVLRAGRLRGLSVRPAFSPNRHRYLLGAWVRDGVTGIGTLTFYDPSRHVFGALGHVIADTGTGRAFPVHDGRIVAALVSGLQRGRDGDPGEKLGVFLNEASPWGRIVSNTPVGIFGKLLSGPSGGLFNRPVPVAAEDQVHVGPAEVLTVLHGRRVQAFGIAIEQVVPQSRPAGKGLVLRVTDPRLLAATGGIVQGMSGSPILQDGRLVGAVTHVFVHDPTRGYGVLAVWMAEQAGLYAAGEGSRAAAGTT